MAGVADYIAGGNLEQLMQQARAQAPQEEEREQLSPEAMAQLMRIIQSPQMAQIFQLASLGRAAAESLPAEIVQQLMAPKPQAPNPGVEALQAPAPLGGVPPSVL